MMTLTPLLAALWSCAPPPISTEPPSPGRPAAATPDTVPQPVSLRVRPRRPDTTMSLRAVGLGGQPVHWTVDGEPVGDVLGAVVPAERTSRGQRWTATVDDAQASVRIHNAPPSYEAPVIQPLVPMAWVDDLECSMPVVGDADGDELSLRFRWWVDGQLHSRGERLPASELEADALWWCEAIVSDGRSRVEAMSAPVRVEAFDPSRVDPYVEAELSFEPAELVPGEEIVVRYSGVLRDEPDAVVQIGVDGWAIDAGGMHQDATPEGYPTYYWELPLEEDVDGARGARFTLPEGVRAVHARVQVPGEPALIDDADGEEYHGEVDFPLIGPYLGWDPGMDPRREVAISWKSATPGLGVVLFGEDQPNRVVVGEEVAHLHRVVLSDLEPDRSYTYRVYDGSGRVSADHELRTLPESLDRMDLLVLADAQDLDPEEDRWPEVAAGALATVPEARAVLAPGDLAAADNPGHWWRFFAGGRELFATVPIVPAVGNHDTPEKQSHPDRSSFQRYFGIPEGPGGSAVNVQDVGPVRLIQLDTEEVDLIQEGAELDMWLEDQADRVRAGDSPPWVIAALHHPPYTAGDRFADEQPDYRAMTRHFDGVVDWVFAGHEHIAQRFLPLRAGAELAPSGRYGTGPEDGVGYAVVPSGGTRVFERLVRAEDAGGESRDLLAWPEPESGQLVVDSQVGFIHVRIEPDCLQVSTWGMGTHLDSASPEELDRTECSSPGDTAGAGP